MTMPSVENKPVRFAGFGGKNDLLLRYTRGRRVLHLGAIGSTGGTVDDKLRAAPSSVHALLSRVSECIGVDIDEEGVNAVAEAGIFDNLLVGDVLLMGRQDIPLESIDVIVAGDIIEHLSNPGEMLERLHPFSGPSTKFIITTPNALGLANFLRYLRGRSLEGSDHVCSFNVFSLSNLLERHGWEIESIYTCYQDLAPQLTSAAAFRVGKALFEWQPRLGGTLFAVTRTRLPSQSGA